MTSSVCVRLWQLIEGRLHDVDREQLALDVARLSDAFTTGRSDLDRTYFNDPRVLRAYLSLFFPINAVKVLHCLGEAQDLGLIPSKPSLQILDLGCGPGTASIAASLFFSERAPKMSLEILGIDRTASAIREAHSLFDLLNHGRHAFRGEVGDICADQWTRVLPRKSFDVIIAANVLNECGGEQETSRICRTLSEKHLVDGGLFLMIDPALRHTTRSLMKMRGDLLAASLVLDVCAPCLHRHPCPMRSANERDWCHFYLEWERPEIVRHIDDLTGLDHRHLKMAYVILVKQETGSRKHEKNCARVVSSPLISKGKRELVLCRADGRLQRVMRQDKDVTDDNRDFGHARRGDIVAMTGDRVEKDSDVHILKTWQP